MSVMGQSHCKDDAARLYHPYILLVCDCSVFTGFLPVNDRWTRGAAESFQLWVNITDDILTLPQGWCCSLRNNWAPLQTRPKTMVLPKMVYDTSEDWHPRLVFAEHEVPQAFTCLFLFEVLSDWDVPGLLGQVQHAHTPSEERLDRYHEEAEVNLREAWRSHTIWYDQQAWRYMERSPWHS